MMIYNRYLTQCVNINPDAVRYALRMNRQLTAQNVRDPGQCLECVALCTAIWRT